MPAPEILYRMTWTWPYKPDQEFRALVNHAASMDLVAVLEAAGATVRRTAHETRVSAPAGDERPADGHRRFREAEHIGYRYPVTDEARWSSGNGTEFS